MRASAAASIFTSSIFATSILAYGLTGCGSKSTAGVTGTSSNPTSAAFGGKAMVGKLPLSGASVQLYSAGTTGSGSAGTALLSAPLTTDPNGAFSVAAGYTCPAAASQLYLVARGGKAGTAVSANSAIVLMTPLGRCDQLASGSQFMLNEVTTTASAYALAQFLSAGANAGSSSSNATGIRNAVATAQVLSDIFLGTSPGMSFASNGSSPASTINSVANMLNACAAAAPSASACTGLFAATTGAVGAAPSNLLDAALNLARRPASNVAALYTLATASSAFAPTVTGPPADWTVSVNYTGGGMNSPTAVGIDSAGNIWIANYFNVASAFSPTGVPLFSNGITGSGLSASYGLAVDSSNNIWIPNEPSSGHSGNSVTVLNASGQSVAGANGFTTGGLNYPIAVAIDSDGSAWVADYGNSHVTHLSSAGVALSGASGYSDASIAFPAALAVDTSHNVWVANQTGTTVTKVASNGSSFTPYSCCDAPSALALDAHGNIWIANYYGDSVSEISSSGTIVSSGGYTGGGLNHPQGIAIDGTGNVWVANFRVNALSELAGADAAVPGAALSPAAGIGSSAKLLEAFGLAIDSSGNLWVSNFGSNILTEYVGLASPVRTPLIGPPAAP